MAVEQKQAQEQTTYVDPFDDMFPGGVTADGDVSGMAGLLADDDGAGSSDPPEDKTPAEAAESKDTESPKSPDSEPEDGAADVETETPGEAGDDDADDDGVVSRSEYRKLQLQLEEALAKVNGQAVEPEDEVNDQSGQQDTPPPSRPSEPRVINFTPFAMPKDVAMDLGEDTAGKLGTAMNAWVQQHLIPELASGIMQFMPERAAQDQVADASALTHQVLGIQFMSKYPQYRRMPRLVGQALREVLAEKPDLDDVTLYEEAFKKLESTDAKASAVKTGKARVDARGAKREPAGPGTGSRARETGQRDNRSEQEKLLDDIVTLNRQQNNPLDFLE